MTIAVGAGQTYLWRDGSTSSLAPPSDAIDVVLQNPTQWAIDNDTAINYDKVYRGHADVGAACRFRAGQLARVRLAAFIKQPKGGAIRDDKSLFAKMLANPAPRRSAHELKRDIELDLCVNGNHLEEIVFTDRGKLELRRIFWSKVRPKFNQARTRVDYWEIHDQPTGTKPRLLSNFEVIHFAAGSTDGPLGVSPLEQLHVAVVVDRAAQAHQLSTLRNGAKMGVVVVIDPVHAKDPELVESVRAEFTSRYAGMANSGRPFVAGGIDIKHVPQQSLVDAELINTQKVSREKVSGVLQVPTLFLGDMGRATMNTYAEAHLQLFKTTLAEPMDSIAGALGAQLIAEHDVARRNTSASFEATTTLWGDPSTRAKTYRDMLAAGAITIDEIRELEGRELFDEEWARLPMLNLNNQGNPGTDDAGEGTGGANDGEPGDGE